MDRDKQRKAVSEVVDLMLLGDSVVVNYRKKMGGEEGEAYQESLDMKDRLMFAHILGMMVAHLDQQEAQAKALEAQAKAQEIQRAQVEQALKADEQVASQARSQQKVQLDPDRTEQEFMELLRLNKVSVNTAGRVLGAMLNTLEGQRMLQVLLWQSVQGHRAAGGQAGGG